MNVLTSRFEQNTHNHSFTLSLSLFTCIFYFDHFHTQIKNCIHTGSIFGQQVEDQALSMAHGISGRSQATHGRRNVGSKSNTNSAQGHFWHAAQKQAAAWLHRAASQNLYGSDASAYRTTADERQQWWRRGTIAQSSGKVEWQLSFRLAHLCAPQELSNGSQY